MERTAIRLGGLELGSSIANASGACSTERGEIYEMCAVHHGLLVLKSCNTVGLSAPESLKNPGVEHFAAIVRELVPRGKAVAGSIVGASDDEVVAGAVALDRAGAQIIELNLADAYVLESLAPFSSMDRLGALLRRLRDHTGAAIAVKIPARVPVEARAIAEVLKRSGIAIVVCANDLPKDLEFDLPTAAVRGPARILSQVRAFHRTSDGVLDVVAVGGIGSGRDAYLAHLTGAKAVQVGSAVVREGPGALGRIDRELDTILARYGKRSVSEVIGRLAFRG